MDHSLLLGSKGAVCVLGCIGDHWGSMEMSSHPTEAIDFLMEVQA